MVAASSLKSRHTQAQLALESASATTVDVQKYVHSKSADAQSSRSVQVAVDWRAERKLSGLLSGH